MMMNDGFRVCGKVVLFHHVEVKPGRLSAARKLTDSLCFFNIHLVLTG